MKFDSARCPAELIAGNLFVVHFPLHLPGPLAFACFFLIFYNFWPTIPLIGEPPYFGKNSDSSLAPAICFYSLVASAGYLSFLPRNYL